MGSMARCGRRGDNPARYGAGYEGEWAKVMGAGQEINIAIHLVLQFKHSKTCV
jgi:hypothetical protein